MNRIRIWNVLITLLSICVLWSCNSQQVSINPCEKIKERLCNSPGSSDADCSEGTSIYNRSVSGNSYQEKDARTICQNTLDKQEELAAMGGFSSYDELMKSSKK